MPEKQGARPPVPDASVVGLQVRFKQGLALHQQGKLAEAERIYREVLQQQPDHMPISQPFERDGRRRWS